MSEAGRDATATSDVEAHGMHWSDENLKEAIVEVENALDSLRRLETETQNDEQAEVEAHGMHWSDENLKQAIAQMQSALEALKKLQTAGSKPS